MNAHQCQQLRAQAEASIGAAGQCYAQLLLAEVVDRIDPEAVAIHGAGPDHDGLRILAVALRYAREPDPPVYWRSAVEDALRKVMSEPMVPRLQAVAYDLAADQVEIGPPLRDQWDAWFDVRLSGP